MNILNFFLIPQFIQILNSFGKITLPSRIEFNGNEDLRFLIDTSINRNDDIVFSVNFYKKNKIVDMANITRPTILLFLAKFDLYVQNFLTLKKDPKIPKYKTLFKCSRISFTLMKRIIKETNISRKILFLYLNRSLNLYTVNGFNNVSVSRTIIRSFHRINIISSEIVKNENLQILMNFHNLNITLFNYILQNNLSLFFDSLMVLITLVRICIMMVWIISNLVIFTVSKFSQMESNIMFNIPAFYTVTNIVFLAIWLYLPKIVISMIKLNMKINKVNYFGE